MIDILDRLLRRKKGSVIYGPFSQEGTLDGVPIMVGGRSDPVPIHLEDGGTVHNCVASRQVAKRIAEHLFTNTIRVQGIGRWRRDEGGHWTMDSFRVFSFNVLDDRPLKDVVADLRAIKSALQDTDDPIRELHRIRYGDEEEENHA